MSARKTFNTRMGGHAAATRSRQIVADPAGNREQRRAARKLGIALSPSAVGGEPEATSQEASDLGGESA